MADVQLAVVEDQLVQLAVLDDEQTQLALAAPNELILNLAVPGTQGPVGVSFPATGGTVNQVLIKNSSADFDASWVSAWDVSGLTINDGTY
jgi:hypothetical protein